MRSKRAGRSCIAPVLRLDYEVRKSLVVIAGEQAIAFSSTTRLPAFSSFAGACVGFPFSPNRHRLQHAQSVVHSNRRSEVSS